MSNCDIDVLGLITDTIYRPGKDTLLLVVAFVFKSLKT